MGESQGGQAVSVDEIMLNRLWIQRDDLLKENERLEDRIKRLEEALNGTVKWIVDLAESGDAGFWDADTFPEVIAARAALNTKEVKP